MTHLERFDRRIVNIDRIIYAEVLDETLVVIALTEGQWVNLDKKESAAFLTWFNRQELGKGER